MVKNGSQKGPKEEALLITAVFCTYWPLKQPLNTRNVSISLRESNSLCPKFILRPPKAFSVHSVMDFFTLFLFSKTGHEKEFFFFVTRFWKNLLWQITTIYMLKIFHNNFFENLSDPIPAFLSTKKFGLLNTLYFFRLSAWKAGRMWCISFRMPIHSWTGSTSLCSLW